MSWRTVNLGELVDNFSVRAKDHDSDTSELEFCGVSNEEGITKSKYAAEDKAEDYKIIEKDCFAYNPYRINVGSIGLLEDDTVGLISPAYVVFKPKPRSIIPQLLLKFLKSSEGLRQIKLYARGTVRQALRFEDLCKIELAIPDYEEQLDFFKRIEETEIESKEISTELTHQLDLVKQLRQSFLREAMQGKLVLQDPNDEPASVLLEKIKTEKERLIKEEKIKKQKPLPPITQDEIPFEIPENWVWCRFYEVCEIESNLVNPDDYLDYPHIAPNNIEKNTSRLLEYKSVREDELISSKHLFYPDQLLYSKVRPKLNKVVKVDFTGLCSADMYPLKPNINSDFMLWCMLSEYFLIEVDRFDNRVKMPKINQKQLSQIPIPLAPLSEQQRIVAKLDELMAYCDELEVSIKESQQQNELLLQQVLREALEPKEREVEKV